MQLQSILDWLAAFAPLRLAESWDNVGLLLGDPGQPVRKAMTCLTVTPASAAEAVREGAELIVSHHPVLFKPTQRLTTATPEGRLLLPLLRAGVAVYSPHTAFDNCRGGINDLLAERLGLLETRPLKPRERGGASGRGPAAQLKLVAFVPEGDLQRVSEALFAAGAGRIGAYEQCSFRAPGTGTFYGTESANPAVGQKGRREEAPEWRLEVVVPSAKLEAAVRGLRLAHSYEEPAFDVYPLLQAPSRTPELSPAEAADAGAAGEGAGRLGALPQPLPLRTLAQTAARALRVPAAQFVGDPARQVRRAAVVCGAGGSMLEDALQAGADVFLTGEMRFHDLLAAEAAGVAVVLAGHHATERHGVERLAERLGSEFPELTAWASRAEQDPLQHLSAAAS